MDNSHLKYDRSKINIKVQTKNVSMTLVKAVNHGSGIILAMTFVFMVIVDPSFCTAIRNEWMAVTIL